jgi:hypothetical protein
LLGALAELLRATLGFAAPPQEHFPANAPGCKAPVPARNTAGSARDVSFTWSGSCIKGFVEGPGKLEKFRRGELVATYTGEFVHGKLEGHGLLVFANGERYEGEFYEGRRDGYGTYTFANGARYEGYFARGISSRSGVLRLPGGDKFITDLVVAEDWLNDAYEPKPSKRYPHADLFVVCFSASEVFESLTPVRLSGMARYDDEAAMYIKIRAYTAQKLVSEPIPGCHMVAFAFGPNEYQVIYNHSVGP